MEKLCILAKVNKSSNVPFLKGLELDTICHYCYQLTIGKIIMEALEPIPTKGLTLKDTDDLMAKVYKIMSDKNDELRTMLRSEYKQGKLPFCKNL